MYVERTYRRLVDGDRFTSFRVVVKETDVLIHTTRDLRDCAHESILAHRRYLEAYIERFPEFAVTLAPFTLPGPAPKLVIEMAEAGALTHVGPMAAVAGALAEQVSLDLLAHTDEVIVENGGDTFVQTRRPVTVGIFAGDSPLSLKLGLRIAASDQPAAVCTSSGTFGHSLSLGCADALCVIASSGALADAAATALGNRVRSAEDIAAVIDHGKKIKGLRGVVAIVGPKIGFWGALDLVPLSGKKG